MLNKEILKEVIREYHKPVITGLIAFLLGYFINKNGGYIILGSGKNVNIEMTQNNEDLESPDSTDVNEVNFFPKSPIFLILHCLATPSRLNVDKQWLTTCFKQKYGPNWKYGYQGVIDLNGKFIELIHIDNSPKLEWNEIAWGCKGYNSISINLAYAGGVDEYGKPKNTLTESQINSLRLAIRYYKAIFPNLIVVPHNKFAHKACPSFDVSILEEE